MQLPFRRRPLLALIAVLLPASAEAEPAAFSVATHNVGMTVRAQTPEEAFDYLWSTLGNMPFFRDNGYQVALPDDQRIRQLASGELVLTDSEYEKERARFIDALYRSAAFDPGLEALANGQHTLELVIGRLRTFEKHWAFKVFDRYQVLLTLYGPGGSFDPDQGIITLFTTEDGSFKGGGGVMTTVHEMVHLGIEHSIVRRFSLTHWEKERLVDLICQRGLGDLLPGYRLQQSGESALDSFIDTQSLNDLPAAIEKYIEAHSR